MITEKINQDLKAAMLSGDKDRVTVIRGIKSVILDAEISSGSREQGMDDDGVIRLLQKEAKKRTDAIKLYEDAGDQARADAERFEQDIIKEYLPESLSEEELSVIVDQVIDAMGGSITRQQMGQAIAGVKVKAGNRADGSMIARLVQERIQG